MGTYNKFWVALLIVAANAIRSRYNIDIGIDDQLAGDLVGGVGAMLVYLVPNKKSA
jgi:hypothetical protein